MGQLLDSGATSAPVKPPSRSTRAMKCVAAAGCAARQDAAHSGASYAKELARMLRSIMFAHF